MIFFDGTYIMLYESNPYFLISSFFQDKEAKSDVIGIHKSLSQTLSLKSVLGKKERKKSSLISQKRS